MSFWKDKKVLVTGAGGFVGSNLTKALIKKGAFVVTYTRGGFKEENLLSFENLQKRVGIQYSDSVLNFDKLLQAVKKNRVEIIYHLAAQPLVETGKESPIETFQVNIEGTWNVLEVARRVGVKKVIVASTTHVYGDNPNLPYKEEYYPQPSRPYETSKACADLLSQSFADTYNLSVEIPRFTNLYGPGDLNFGRVVPKVVKEALENKKVKIWDVGAVRDFLFIDDAVRAYLVLVEKELSDEKRSRVFNFGSGKPLEIVKLAKKIIGVVGDKAQLEIVDLPEQREREIQKQYVSIEKAREVLNWKPVTKLDDGLKKTVRWYRKYFRNR